MSSPLSSLSPTLSSSLYLDRGNHIRELPTLEGLLQTAQKTYCQTFGIEPELACCAPGRVNLIGEHVDYNDGFVLPMALPMVTVIVGGQRVGNDVDLITCCTEADEPKRVTFSIVNLQSGEKSRWTNYVKGVIHGFMQNGGQLSSGFNAVVVSSVPVGAGLSSSAALEVATLTFLEHISGHKIESDVKRALICQKAEHLFAGVPCGIMDQMIALLGRKHHVLLLDCRSLETYQIPFVADERELVVLICNSNVRHELSNSEYPTRRKQCLQALNIMALKSYRDATESNLSAFEGSRTDEVLLRRARHVITEIHRTQEAVMALREHDFQKLGELMTKSHMSLRDDFQVSCMELDVLVDAAINCPGVLGSRMTGGGFGGCTITLLQRNALDDVITTMREHFIKKFNNETTGESRIEFYVCCYPCEGARKLEANVPRECKKERK